MTENEKFAALLEASKPQPLDMRLVVTVGLALVALFAFMMRGDTAVVDKANSSQTQQLLEYSGLLTTVEGIKSRHQDERATRQRDVTELRSTFSREIEALEDDVQAEVESLDDDFAARIEGVVRTQDANINRRESELRTELYRSIDSIRDDLKEQKKLLLDHINSPVASHIKQ